ncbi:hypothetical protein MGG_17474 [Pyricularia oryzae 70-15]|uniref:Uncharacterized protein n=1 Tax=Pyricularia oryzae (strain 70-15 / ATCC MYA-4617 / FGSC 8958) TaxID=242507 RepID=G4NCX7_PYRO7|nr:uncharacterized protein MGG_17474 [Pyricularia oryzae 70-15]EHA49167.1 hypothetical protein MGG_17474 [Pyricularia oryzae 70-15]
MSANADLQLHTLLLLLADGPKIDQEGMGEFIVVHMYGDIPDYGGARQRLDRRRGVLTATGHTKQPELEKKRVPDIQEAATTLYIYCSLTKRNCLKVASSNVQSKLTNPV